MSRKAERTNVFKIIFSVLMSYENDEDLLNSNDFLKKFDVNSEFESNILTNLFTNLKKYIEYLSTFLKTDWTWKRLPYIDKAVLLLAVSEWNTFKTEKPIIINECLNLIKKFGEEKNFNYVNAVLDRALK